MKKNVFLHSYHRKYPIKSRLLILSIIFLFTGSFFIPISPSTTVDQSDEQYGQSLMTVDGQILYCPMWTTSTYLIENNGAVNHSWQSSYFPGVMVRWLGDGTILRTIRVGAGPGTGGAGGGVQKVEWDGSVTWDFRYSTTAHLSHHDVKALPNGNVLLIAWESKTRSEAIAAGRNPSYVSNQGMTPDHIIEVQPTGPSSGEIVWEWHVWDHLIQNYDPTKENFGVVADHPELVDVNFQTSTQDDWMHTNSIDYNEEFDQILISVCYFSEVWVIDHSTTTEEAAGHTGGNSGKGGDLLYRWGNPQAYDAGTSSNQKLFNQHDATWIGEGYPGEGDILVFNNGVNRHYSTIDEIIPPVNENGEYSLTPGSAYEPTSQSWTYTATPASSFYVSHLGGAQRLSSGNTLITNGESGKVFEVTPEGTTVWQYNTGGQLFKVEVIPFTEPEEPEPNLPNLDCSGSLSWSDIEPGATVNGSFKVQNIGNVSTLLNWTVDTSSISWGTWTFTPEEGENLTPEEGLVTVHVSVVAPDEGNSEFEGYIRVENKNDPTDFDTIPVSLTTPYESHDYQTPLYHFFMKWIQVFAGKISTFFQFFLPDFMNI